MLLITFDFRIVHLVTTKRLASKTVFSGLE